MTGLFELPCKNPSCKSHGVPHPNCKCYGSMAEGGDVSHFCSKNQRHEVDCPYFADGGTLEEPLHTDPSHSIGAYLSHGGLHNLLKFHEDISPEALDKYNHHVKKGKKHLETHIESLFTAKQIVPKDVSKAKKAIHEWIEKGGVVSDLHDELSLQHPQNYADGGEVKESSSKILHNHPIAQAYPEQDVMLQAAKGRMSTYLNTLKPQDNEPRLSFDAKPDQKEKKKAYEKALHIAAHPLSILEKVDKGTLLPDDIQHFRSLHPEVDDLVQKKLTERVVKDQFENKKPSYKVRQGLSMVLGAPLASEMTQPNLQAIQATFQSKQPEQQNQAPTKNKKNTSTLTKASQSYLTRNEALTARQQKQ